jgi:hypothetical protein
MSNEQKESRIKVDDIQQPDKELSPEEAKKVQGGIFDDPFFFDTNAVKAVDSSTQQGDGSVIPTSKTPIRN